MKLTTLWSALHPTGTLKTAFKPALFTSSTPKSKTFPPSFLTHSTSHFALPTAQMARPPPGGNMGDAPLHSPNPPTEETVRWAPSWEEGRWAVWRRWVKWLVRIGMGVEGLRGGREGVRRPYFGSADKSVFVISQSFFATSKRKAMKTCLIRLPR